MARYYCTFQLSDNIGRTPEGYLVCKNAIIARTGFQRYKGRELGDLVDAIEQAGHHIAPEDIIDIYRSADEVFHPDTIASFEGKPVTDGHPANGEFVNPDNIVRLQRGFALHVSNEPVPLEDGNLGIQADVLITHPDLIDPVVTGDLRELSCGYDYDIAIRDGKIQQVNIRGNHVAVVPRGRAGAEARIFDSAAEVQEPPVVEVIPPVVTTSQKKEHRVSISKLLLAIGLKQRAVDATPEQLAEDLDALQKEGVTISVKGENRAADAHEEEAEKKEKASDKKASDKKAKDAEKDEKSEKGEDAVDSVGKAIDEYFGADCESEDAEKADDEKEDEKSERGEDSEEEEEESEAGEDAEPEDKEEDKSKKGKGEDAISLISGADKPRRGARAADAAVAADAAMTVLKTLRPFIAKARSGDAKSIKRLHRAFDAVATSVNKNVKRTGTGSYKEFAAAATTLRATDAKSTTEAEAAQKLNADYAKMHGRAITEVK